MVTSSEKIVLACDHVNDYIVAMTMWVPRLDDRPGPRYRAIADSLSDDIAAGHLPPGARLPTHRWLADRLGVTVGTVTRAYLEAARRGLLSGEVGRGTFVRAAGPDEAETDGAMVDLSHNHPPIPHLGPLADVLQRTLATLATRGDLASLLGYPADGGRLAHREAGAEWIGRAGLRAPPESVLVCAGSQHALTTVLATLLQPGDVLLAETVTYPGLKALANLLHVRLEGLPLDRDGLRPDALEDACRTTGARALYIVPTIQNPTCGVMPQRRREEIAEVARAQGIAIIEDDIHALLAPQRPLPLAAAAPERTYYLTSVSKTLAPGLRVGYILAPPGQAARLAAGVRATTWGAAPLTAEVATSWIRDGTADALLAARRAEAAARQELAAQVLAGATYDAHPVGYHLWLHLPEPWRSESFAAQAARRGVSVTPAEAFVVGRGAAPHAVRLCLGPPRSREALGRGLRLVAETLGGPPDAGMAMV
jgi:DNA-binding transcriptional MocR family regulator